MRPCPAARPCAAPRPRASPAREKAIPACIRDPIKKFIIEHILSAIPIISTFMKVPDVWEKIQKLVMDFLAQVFVKGDLGGAAMMVIRFVLEAAGINVDLFLNILANAADALDTIIMHPVEFLKNLWGALKKGMGQFVSNIGQHLINGLLAWMLGPLEDLGVKPPKDLSLGSLLDLVLQILGITAEKLRKKVEKVVGPAALKVIDEAWKWISALMKGGLAGLWEEIKTRLSDLWGMVIGGLSQWITVELVEAGVAKLITMSNPAGAVIEALRTIYKTVTFIVGKINQVLALANSIVNSIAKIAGGMIDDAANWIESAMARTVPLIINFFADWIGIGSPAPKIREIVTGIQAKVDAALDWLADKAAGIGRSILKALGLGKDTDDHDEKWNAGVQGVTRDVEKMKAKGLEEQEIRDRFPEWQSTYGFSELDLEIQGDDFEILGAMSTKKRVTKAGSGLHSGVSGDPIPIFWYKPPSSYPSSINLTDPQGETITIPMFSRTKVVDPPPGRQGEVTLGVTDNNQIEEGKKLERVGGTAELRGSGQDTLINMLGRLGYNMSSKGMEADHVKDLGFGGVDSLSNLWPLKADINQRGRDYYSSYRVEYIEDGKVKENSLVSMPGKFFEIKGFRYPPPTKPGGRD